MTNQLVPHTTKTIEKGSHFPLGATITTGGVNFALYSRHATEVFLLLFDEPDAAPTDVIQLASCDKYVWHALVKGVRAGQLYGYKVRGEQRPEQGLRFNDAKLLLDPYAKSVTGKFRNNENLLLPYDAHAADRDLVLDLRDNTATVPKGIVVDDAFDWQSDAPPPGDLEELVTYEVHVKGFTAHPSSGVTFPGTYLGFIEKIPQKAAGIRSDPPPSLPSVSGTVPDATAAAEPELEPPVVRETSHGLRVVP